MGPSTPAQKSADQAPRPLVCVIDDDDRLRDAVCAILQQAGFATVEARDGEIGLKIVNETNPAVVVTDIVMPNKEGLETIIALKAQHPDLPVIAMSGAHLPGKQYLEWAMGVGADDFIAKPFQPPRLVEKVRQLLARRP